MKSIYVAISVALCIAFISCTFGICIAAVSTSPSHSYPVGDMQVITGSDGTYVIQKILSVDTSDQKFVLEAQKELVKRIIDYQIKHGSDSVGWSVNVNFFDGK